MSDTKQLEIDFVRASIRSLPGTAIPVPSEHPIQDLNYWAGLARGAQLLIEEFTSTVPMFQRPDAPTIIH